MSTTVVMNAAAIGGTLQLNFSGVVVVPANGLITVDSRDAIDLLRLGATYVNSVQRNANFTAPRAGTAGRFVASTALSNGTLSIANQPDVPRMAQVVMGTGTAALSAGNLALTYLANDGTTQVDNFPTVVGASAATTTSTSKGIQLITSAILTGVSGGTSPFIYISDINYLSFYVDPGFQNFALLREAVDGTAETGGATANAAAASVLPSTAPNGTHNYIMTATYTYPGS